ncbi:MAG: type II toxin-antitoxin system HicB family antitoxin [Magnetococcales bacterium]|nr:type II toxin-antitoxin system HicB family antitoxin [Magnetococcales bacterium]
MAIIEKRGDWYIATCPIISPVGSQGRTKKEAVENLKRVLSIYISSCFDLIITEMINEAKSVNGACQSPG